NDDVSAQESALRTAPATAAEAIRLALLPNPATFVPAIPTATIQRKYRKRVARSSWGHYISDSIAPARGEISVRTRDQLAKVLHTKPTKRQLKRALNTTGLTEMFAEKKTLGLKPTSTVARKSLEEFLELVKDEVESESESEPGETVEENPNVDNDDDAEFDGEWKRENGFGEEDKGGGHLDILV
ncbi:hypothetical protein HDU99_000984, partial [Rhizoclosmatium hyalinum]